MHAHHFRRNLPQKEGKKTKSSFFANMSSVMLKVTTSHSFDNINRGATKLLL